MSPFQGMVLGDRVRQEGAFELWSAELAGRGLLLRRVAEGLGLASPAHAALARASELAARVAHDNVLLCHGHHAIEGEPVQISERPVHAELTALMSSPLDPRVSTWIVRQVLEALVHAESLEIVHGNLGPEHIYAGAEGSIRVDFGAASSPGGRRDDLAALATLWSTLMGDHLRPASIDRAIARAIDPRAKDAFRDAKSFAAALARIFYAELDGDDVRDGAQAIADRVSSAMGTKVMPRVFSQRMTNPEVSMPRGTFTRMLEERARPVEPKPLSIDDVDSQVVHTWTPPAAQPMAQPITTISDPFPQSVVTPAAIAERSVWAVWFAWFLLGFAFTLFGLRVLI